MASSMVKLEGNINNLVIVGWLCIMGYCAIGMGVTDRVGVPYIYVWQLYLLCSFLLQSSYEKDYWEFDMVINTSRLFFQPYVF